MNEEIKEEILTTICNVDFQCSGDCVWCEKISEALINAGYRKQEVKTNGGKFRSMSDEDFAGACIVLGWNEFADARCYISILTHCVYDTYEKAYQANLEWLKQEYKGE